MFIGIADGAINNWKFLNPNTQSHNKIISDIINKKLSPYFTIQLPRMNYHKYIAQNLPIDSEIIEALCKTLIKQLLCLMS